jgi:sugar/nucleoside kinase (ribokinase family)
MAEPTIPAFGQLLWNLFAEGTHLGGGPATFAWNVALLGCEVALVSAVGKDTRGATAVAPLSRKRRCVNCSFVINSRSSSSPSAPRVR